MIDIVSRSAKVLGLQIAVICFAFPAFPLLLNAQSSPIGGTRVEGTVRDSSGASILTSQVELRSGTHSVTQSVNSSGNFDFENVEGNSGSIIVTAKGFKQVERSWDAAPGKQVHLEIILVPEGVNKKIVV